MKVFISHSSRDEALASKVASYLERAGLDVWYDKREILPGDNWGEKIAQGLRESDAMVVLLTSGALKPDFMRRDVDFALSQKPFKRRVVPVIVGNTEDLQDQELPWIFDRLHTINIRENGGNEEELNELAQVLKNAA
jgi:TIR domain-containing protein